MLWQLGAAEIHHQHLQGYLCLEMKWVESPAEVQATWFGIFQNSFLTPWQYFIIKTLLLAVRVF